MRNGVLDSLITAYNALPSRQRGGLHFLVVIIVISLTFATGSWWGQRLASRRQSNTLPIMNDQREFHAEYPLVNPLLDCAEWPPSTGVVMPIETATEEFINEQLPAGTRVSVYYRDLLRGGSFGVNDQEAFLPASLTKVHLLVIYLKLAELKLVSLEEALLYDGRHADQQNLTTPEKQLQAGESYTIANLLNRMIVYSDTEALAILLDRINTSDEATFAQAADEVTRTVLGPIELQDATATPVEIARVFRLLYNASYLSVANSQYALELLERSEFERGLKLQLPSDTAVAHKFGFREESGGTLFHDCGIVYHPQTPYLLCVMTEGPATVDRYEFVQQLSRRIYDAVSALPQK